MDARVINDVGDQQQLQTMRSSGPVGLHEIRCGGNVMCDRDGAGGGVVSGPGGGYDGEGGRVKVVGKQN